MLCHDLPDGPFAHASRENLSLQRAQLPLSLRHGHIRASVVATGRCSDRLGGKGTAASRSCMEASSSQSRGDALKLLHPSPTTCARASRCIYDLPVPDAYTSLCVQLDRLCLKLGHSKMSFRSVAALIHP